MNAGKSTTLLQSCYNYNERGMHTVIFSPAIDDRYQVGKVTSRLGIESNAEILQKDTDILKSINDLNFIQKIDCILIDEAQFLTKQQVFQITEVVDQLNIPVLTYGLRTDFQANPFEGSQYLLLWADNLVEIKTVCHCGKKANHVLRVDKNGKVITHGEQLEIGGNDSYISVCRKHHKMKIIEGNKDNNV
jgi:thymidine kinase